MATEIQIDVGRSPFRLNHTHTGYTVNRFIQYAGSRSYGTAFFFYSILLCSIAIYQCDLNSGFPTLCPAYKYVSTDFIHNIEV